MISRLSLLCVTLGVAMISGCSSLGVKPWQRDVLARIKGGDDPVRALGPSGRADDRPSWLLRSILLRTYAMVAFLTYSDRFSRICRRFGDRQRAH